MGARAASSYGPKRHESLPDPLDRRSDRRERPSPVWMPRPLPELKRCRIAAGVTQEELAGRARVARETLCKIERGRPATRETVRRLAAALAVPPGVLAGTVTGTRCERAHDKSGAPDRGSVPRATQRYQSSGLTAHGAGDGRDAPRTAPGDCPRIVMPSRVKVRDGRISDPCGAPVRLWLFHAISK